MGRLLKQLIVNRLTRAAAFTVIRPILRNSYSRELLNLAYERLPNRGKAVFGTLVARVFWDQPHNVNGLWRARFLTEKLCIPLRAESINLDWIYALSVETHDRPILDTYENIIQSPTPPKTFIDAGANFGMHSLIFSKLGVRTVAFEPNPVCGAYAATIFALNKVAPEWHPVALGSGDGSVDLFFPERETWLGTTVSNIADNLGANLRVVSVPLKALDTYSDSITDPVLIKIDVEGAEVPALRSGIELIHRHRPLIIFEANDAAAKTAMAEFMNEVGYQIHSLPFDPARTQPELTQTEFLRDPQTNFVAKPA